MDITNAIFAANAKLERIVPIDVPQWPETKGQLYIRHMTYQQFAHWQCEYGKFRDGKPSVMGAVAALYALCDSTGKRVFTDLDVVSSLNPEAIDAIETAWIKLHNEAGSVSDEKKD